MSHDVYAAFEKIKEQDFYIDVYAAFEKIKEQDFYICVDQDFIDTYYLVLREFSSKDAVIKNMKKMFEMNASLHVKTFDIHDLRKNCVFINSPSNGIVMNSDYHSFITHIIPFYMKNIDRYSNTFVMIGEKTDKKRYIIKLSFDDVLYLNSISASIGGSILLSSRYLFSDGFNMMGPVITNHIFGCNSYIRSGNSTSVYFNDDVIDYINKYS